MATGTIKALASKADVDTLKSNLTALNSKFSKTDLVFTGLDGIKNYLLTTYGNQIGEYFDFLSVMHTDNSETAMEPHVRWVGYVCKDTGGNSLIFVAHSRFGKDIKLIYSFYDQAWTLSSLIGKVGEFTIQGGGSTSFALPGDGIYLVAGYGSAVILQNAVFLIGGYATASRCAVVNLSGVQSISIDSSNTSSLIFTASNSNPDNSITFHIIKLR